MLFVKLVHEILIENKVSCRVCDQDTGQQTLKRYEDAGKQDVVVVNRQNNFSKMASVFKRKHLLSINSK